MLFAIEAAPVNVEAVRAASEEADEALLVTDERHALFTAVVAGESQARTGATARLAVDSRRFHYFDPATGDLVGGARADASAAAR